VSRHPKKERTRLSEPDQALAGYLESLLSEVQEYREEPSPSAKPLAKAVEYVPEGRVVKIPLKEEVLAAEKEEIVLSPQAAVTAASIEEQGPTIPVWGQEPFQCLLFKVKGLTLAVPLVALDSIAGWRDDLVNLPGQPDWHLGVLRHRGTKVGIVDTARLVMPERLTTEEEAAAPSHVLIIGGGQWGLLCEKLLKPIALDPTQVRWCGQQGKPPWMAGTLPEQLCILLDVDALLEMIRPRA
jgi:purine-binding chemotaxis protein CheW